MKLVNIFSAYLFLLSQFSVHVHFSDIEQATAFNACEECEDSTTDENHHHKHECAHQHCQNFNFSCCQQRCYDVVSELLIGFSNKYRAIPAYVAPNSFFLIRAPPA